MNWRWPSYLIPKDLRKRLLMALFLVTIGNAPYVVHRLFPYNMISACAGGMLFGNCIAEYFIRRQKRLREVEDKLDWRIK